MVLTLMAGPADFLVQRTEQVLAVDKTVVALGGIRVAETSLAMTTLVDHLPQRRSAADFAYIPVIVTAFSQVNGFDARHFFLLFRYIHSYNVMMLPWRLVCAVLVSLSVGKCRLKCYATNATRV